MYVFRVILHCLEEKFQYYQHLQIFNISQYMDIVDVMCNHWTAVIFILSNRSKLFVSHGFVILLFTFYTWFLLMEDLYWFSFWLFPIVLYVDKQINKFYWLIVVSKYKISFLMDISWTFERKSAHQTLYNVYNMWS